jgi:hypothetical protein
MCIGIKEKKKRKNGKKKKTEKKRQEEILEGKQEGLLLTRRKRESVYVSALLFSSFLSVTGHGSTAIALASARVLFDRDTPRWLESSQGQRARSGERLR